MIPEAGALCSGIAVGQHQASPGEGALWRGCPSCPAPWHALLGYPGCTGPAATAPLFHLGALSWEPASGTRIPGWGAAVGEHRSESLIHSTTHTPAADMWLTGSATSVVHV